MRYTTSALLVALAAMPLSRCAQAQTAYAPGGLLVNPTAFTPKHGAFSLYSAGFDQYEEVGRQDNYLPTSLTYSPTDKLAVSALGVYHDGFHHARHIHVGSFLKYQFTPDTAAHPAFALTGTYVGNDHLEGAVAGVVSHAFVHTHREVLVTHVGLKWGQEGGKDLGSGVGHTNDFGAFGGLEVPVRGGFRLVGEYGTRFKFDRAAASSVGVMWRSRSGSGITVGYANTGRSTRMGFFFGVGLSLGGLK